MYVLVLSAGNKEDPHLKKYAAIFKYDGIVVKGNVQAREAPSSQALQTSATQGQFYCFSTRK